MIAIAELLCFCIGFIVGVFLVVIAMAIAIWRQPNISATRDEEDNS